VHVLGGLDEVVAAGIAQVDGVTVGWTHPLLAAGAHARIGPEERRSRHALLAEALEDPVERARHLARAHISSSSAAAGELAAAAELAASRGLSAVAAELADDAVRLTPDAETRERLERLLLAASAHARAGSFDKARALADELIPQLNEGDERAEALRLRARVTGDIAMQRDFVRRALEDTSDPSICAEANALLVRNYLYSGELDEALTAARAAVSQAAATNDRRRIAAATTTLGLMEVWGRGEPSVDVYRAACVFADSGEDLPAETYSNPHTLIGARALYRYELGQARASYGVGAAAAEAAGETDSLETFWWGLAQLEVRAGRYVAAHEYVGLMLEVGEADERRPLSVRWIDGLLAVYDGHIGEARAALGEVLVAAQEGGNWFFDAYGRSALSFLELTVGDPAAAFVALEPAVSMPFVVEGDPGQTGILPLAAESAIAIGARDRAAELVSTLERRGRELDHTWCLATAGRCRGLLLAEEHEYEGALRALDEALELHEHVPAPFERARTMLALGLVRRRARQRRASREALDEAASVFEELATPLWLEKARAELARIGGRAPSRGELTPNELRIAMLVREGKTNKELAAALFVTDRTVESALTQIYRKLDVRSRTELARKLEQA
jgi:ATP/maltotriose-dependent transcriptional regulator MalT